MIVIDIKGELYQETAAWRRSIGHDVRVLDPWGLVTPDGDSLNPLDLLKSDDPALVDDAYALAARCQVNRLRPQLTLPCLLRP